MGALSPVNQRCFEMDDLPFSLICEPIEVSFATPPLHEKSPPCPQAFTWRGREWRICELLAEWRDYSRRGRMAANMRPEHARRAGSVGSLGVGRFHFRIRTTEDRIFEIYYDRAPKNAGDRKGHWFLLGERKAQT